MFKIEVELGDGMRDGEDVAAALDVVAARLREGYTTGQVVDANGDRAGTWDLETEGP